MQPLCYTASHLCGRPSVLNVIPTREKGGREEDGGGGGMREDEASPQIYVVAVQFVILSGFSLSGKSRWYDGDELPFKAQQIYLLSYFIKYICVILTIEDYFQMH